MSRRLRPLAQGELDGLCGIYSIVNALLLALHSKKPRSSSGGHRLPLTKVEQVDLFLALVTSVVYRSNALRLVVDGLTTNELKYALTRASNWCAERRGLRLVVDQPFRGKLRASRQQVVRALQKHLAIPGTATIVGIEPPLSHWSVVSGVEKSRLVLFDSDGESLVSLGAKNRGTLPIRPHFVFLLTLQTLRETRRVSRSAGTR